MCPSEDSPLVSADAASVKAGASTAASASSGIGQQSLTCKLIVTGTINSFLLNLLCLLTGAVMTTVAFVVLTYLRAAHSAADNGVTPDLLLPSVNVAMIGNSMIYFNDFPRLMETITQGALSQNSCLHGGASLGSLLIEGNGMYPQFMTNRAILEEIAIDDENNDTATLYDYGACTVPQLLLGHDDRIYDPGYAMPASTNDTNRNPCRQDARYLNYAIHHFNASYREYSWDYVLINDNTRNPARANTREHGLATLGAFYVDYLLQTTAVPIFLWTQAYKVESTDTRNMTGLDDVANFTSLTGVGLRAYVARLQAHLPRTQQPRIAPVGLGYLLIYEERPDFWPQLFHCDHLHASPTGSLLQALVVHHTIFDTLPPRNIVLRRDMSTLWHHARMMQHAWEPSNPFPTLETATYIYNVAERIVGGKLPRTYIHYENGEAAYGV